MNQISNLFYEVDLSKNIQVSISNYKKFHQFNLNLTNSSENIDRLRGEYNGLSNDDKQEQNSYEVNDQNKIKNKNYSIIQVNSFQELQKESYLILSNIRSINFQVELLHQRQQKQNLNLKIELNVLMSQFNGLMNDNNIRKNRKELKYDESLR